MVPPSPTNLAAGAFNETEDLNQCFMKSAKTVESYIDSKPEWTEALVLLHGIMNETSLEETIKWGMPVYTMKNKNVAGFSAFKSFVGIWFFQGVFLKDPAGKLINAQEGVTKGLRQWRFAGADEIRENRETILLYLEEATRNQLEGKEIKPDRNKPVEVPVELKEAFSNESSLEACFNALSLSKRREYSEYISQAMREETRHKRLEKILPMIRQGIGLNDKYAR